MIFEKDIYPAFTVGDGEQIVKAMDSLIGIAMQSSLEADTLFRSLNWSWPMLTARARATSTEGITIIEKFTSLVTVLLTTCSPSLIPAIANCKSVLRSIIRGISSIDPEIAVTYLNAVQDHVLPQKAARGFFLDKAAVEQLISLSDQTTDTELSVLTDKLLERVMKSKRLFTGEMVIEFLVKLIKSKNCSSDSASLASRVLVAHKSRAMYDSLMEKLTFIQIQSESSILRKLTIFNFFIQVVDCDSPGTLLPASVSKSELTSNIINYKQSKLVALFSLRLLRKCLRRFPAGFEASAGSPLVRDKLTEINSLIPVMKQIIEQPANPGLVLILQEIVAVILAFKRAFPGSFTECKFDWAKLLSGETPETDPLFLAILVRFVYSLVKDSVPVTPAVSSILVKVVSMDSKLGVQCIRDWFTEGTGRGFVAGQDEANAFVDVLQKHQGSVSMPAVLECVLAHIVSRPDAVKASIGPDESALGAILRSDEIKTVVSDFDLSFKVASRIAKTRKRSLVQVSNDALPDAKHQKTEVHSKPLNESTGWKLPRVSLKNRWKCPPLPAPVADPYDLVLSHWATMVFANELEAVDEPMVNLIELVGSNRLYAAVLSLSSPNECVRSSGFEVLSVVLRALAISLEAKGVESNKFAFREAPQIAMILTWLRNGIPADESGIPAPLPLITTAFIVEAMKIVFDPKSPLYPLVYKHVLSRPAINAMSDIQMWEKLFFSTDGEYFALCRLWMMEVIRIGAMDKESIDLFTRRGVIEAVIEATSNLNGSADEFAAGIEVIRQILNTLTGAGAAKEENAVLSLMRKYSLCQWTQFVSHSKFLKGDE